VVVVTATVVEVDVLVEVEGAVEAGTCDVVVVPGTVVEVVVVVALTTAVPNDLIWLVSQFARVR